MYFSAAAENLSFGSEQKPEGDESYVDPFFVQIEALKVLDGRFIA